MTGRAMAPGDAELMERTVGILDRLVAFPTVAPGQNRDLVAHVADLLAPLGARIRLSGDTTGAAANLFASFGPEAEGGVVLAGNTDVAPVAGQDWRSDPFRLEARGGLLVGRGAADMKGFVACVLAVAPAIAAARLVRPVHVALTGDRGPGCRGARALLADLAAAGIRPEIAIVGRPTSMRIVEGHKGCCGYSTRIRGLDAHGSRPDRGVNANDAAIRYAMRLLELGRALQARAPAGCPFAPPWTTVNIGRIAGGNARDVLACEAVVEWELRPVAEADVGFVTAEIDRFAGAELLPRMRRTAPEASIRRETVGEVAGLVPAAENPARDLLTELTGASGAELAAFSTEAGLLQAAGMAVAICGPGAIEQAHRPDESVSRDELAACLAMLGRLVARLSA